MGLPHIVSLDIAMKLISLPAYTAMSVAAGAVAVSYAMQKVAVGTSDKSTTTSADFPGIDQNDYFLLVLSAIFREKLCVVALVNLAYTGLVWVARLLQKLFFGELRVIESQVNGLFNLNRNHYHHIVGHVPNSELTSSFENTFVDFFYVCVYIYLQHMYDRLLNYLIFKILFVGAVLEPDLKELVVWATWFSMIGFLRVFSMLARDRFEYLSFSPTTPLRIHVCFFFVPLSYVLEGEKKKIN